MARGFRLHQRPRRWAAHFLVGIEQHGDGQRRRQPGAAERGDRRQGDDDAAFHVQDAGTMTKPVLLPPGHLVQRPQRMHRVQMPDHQDAARRRSRQGKPRANAIAKTKGAGQDFDFAAQRSYVVRGQDGHAADRGGVITGALAFHPAPQACHHRGRFERQIGGADGRHRGIPGAQGIWAGHSSR